MIYLKVNILLVALIVAGALLWFARPPEPPEPPKPQYVGTLQIDNELFDSFVMTDKPSALICKATSYADRALPSTENSPQVCQHSDGSPGPACPEEKR